MAHERGGESRPSILHYRFIYYLRFLDFPEFIMFKNLFLNVILVLKEFWGEGIFSRGNFS